jgi:hypothetical protein
MVGALDWMVVALASLLTARARWLVGMIAFGSCFFGVDGVG